MSRAHAHTLHRRVLAIRPTGRGFGFVVLEGPNCLIDWGVKEARPFSSRQIERSIRGLITRLEPELLVVEDTGKAQRRSARARSLAHRARTLIEGQPCALRLITRRKGRELLWQGSRMNQSQAARELAQRFPELKRSLPPERKPWMSQDSRFAIFEALTLGLASFPRTRLEK